MKNLKNLFLVFLFALILFSCDPKQNVTAIDEQAHTETNQSNLNKVQPAPTITWSLERDNLIKRFKLQNDKSVQFYMYVFIEGVGDPIGYYQVNKVSSVNSQLTNPEQIVSPYGHRYDFTVLPSPAEDGSYGTNGNAVFGFTPDEIYIEHNMKYICSTTPLNFSKPVIKLSDISIADRADLERLMNKIR
jgi:hypothetical protein